MDTTYSLFDITGPFEKRVNIEMLRKVQIAILENPDHLDMNEWGHPYELSKIITGEEIEHQEIEHQCRTVGCISGWAVAIADAEAGPEGRVIDEMGFCLLPEEGDLVLRLTHDEAERLFYTNNWPDTYREDYAIAMEHGNHEDAAQAVSDYIEYFIQNEGAISAEPILS